MTASSPQTARISGTRTPPRRRQIWMFASRTMSCADGGSGGGGGRRRTTRAPSRSTRYVRFEAPSPIRDARGVPEPRPCASRYASSSAVGSSSVASSVMPCLSSVAGWTGRAPYRMTLTNESAELRHDGGRLDLHLRLCFDERGDLHDGHRRVVAAHQLAVRGPDLARGREVLRAVGDVPGQARNVLGPGARLGEHGQHVA